MKFSLKKWECNGQTSTNRTKTQEKHKSKDIHQPMTTSTDIPTSALILWCGAAFSPRGAAPLYVVSAQTCISIDRPDEQDVQQSGDRMQTDAVCVRRWICGSCRCSLMSHCSASRLLTPSSKGSKDMRGKRSMLVLSLQIWLQLSDNTLKRLLEYRVC